MFLLSVVTSNCDVVHAYRNDASWYSRTGHYCDGQMVVNSVVYRDSQSSYTSKTDISSISLGRILQKIERIEDVHLALTTPPFSTKLFYMTCTDEFSSNADSWTE